MIDKKIFIATDIHGSLKYFNILLERIDDERPDLLVFLGDLYYHGPRNPLPEEYSPMEVCNLLKNIKIKKLLIKGNCDAEVDEMITGSTFKTSQGINSKGKKVLFTHGHKVSFDNEQFSKYDAVIYGHTHINQLYVNDKTKFINLSSISLPKQNAERCYMILENGVAILKNLDGVDLNKIEL